MDSQSHSLTSTEALKLSDAMLVTLYGAENYRRWTVLKKQLGFTYETNFIAWILDHVESEVAPKQSSETSNVHEDVLANEVQVQVDEVKDYPIMAEEDMEQEEEDDTDGGGLQSSKKWQPQKRKLGENRKTCNICQKSFSRQGTLNEHMDTVHRRVPIRCSFCQFTDFIGRVVRQHEVQSHGVQTDYQCSKCHQYFICRLGLTRHLRRSEQCRGDKTARMAEPTDEAATGTWQSQGKSDADCKVELERTCLVCYQTFLKKQHLEEHVRAVHEGVVYRCSSCPYKTKREITLKVHRINHHGERGACWCPDCRKWFYSTRGYKLHQCAAATAEPDTN